MLPELVNSISLSFDYVGCVKTFPCRFDLLHVMDESSKYFILLDLSDIITFRDVLLVSLSCSSVIDLGPCVTCN